jgi:hypothetical protein
MLASTPQNRSACLVLDDDGLVQRFRELLTYQPGEDVVPAARGEPDDDADGLGRVVLRWPRLRVADAERQQHRRKHQQ